MTRRPRTTDGWATALLAGAVIAGGCGNKPSSPPPPASTPRARTPDLDRDKLTYASLLVRGRPVDHDEWMTWTRERWSHTKIADAMVADPFVQSVAPQIIFKTNLLNHPRNVFLKSYKLRKTEQAGQRFFYLTRPCKPSQTVEVRPWWDMSSTVRVCRDSIRPDTWETRLPSGESITCGVFVAAPAELPGSPCACGPNLLRCAPPDEAAEDRFVHATLDELRATTEYIVASDLPLADLVIGKGTFRTREIELLYINSIAESEHIADPAPLLAAADGWPAGGKFAPRREIEPGQHAGFTTAPAFAWQATSPRQRMRAIYETAWCATDSAPGALPEDLLSLHTPDLGAEAGGWKELAARPICTACHARLDYGIQFFLGYPSPITGSWHFVRGVQGGRGPLYGTGIGDPRGEGVLTPQGFAELAVRQPEFAHCMAKNVVEYVFGPAATEERIGRLVASAPGTEMRFRSLLKMALIEFLACESCESPGASIRRAPGAGGAEPRLSSLLGEHCIACHFDGASIPNLEGPLDRRQTTRLLDQVLSGRMPPTGPLGDDGRRAFLSAAMRQWPDHSDQWAGGFLRQTTDPPAALPVFVVREYARRAGGSTEVPPRLNVLESALDGRDNLFTPNYATLGALEAYRSCARVEAGAARENCASVILDTVWGFQ